MPISLETLRLPASRFPSMSTITMSVARILPLLIQVGVTNKRFSSRRTDKFPSVAATKPLSCSMRPNCTISSRCWRSLTIEDRLGTMENHENPERHGTARLGILTTISWSKYVIGRPPIPAGAAAAWNLPSNSIISSMLVSDFQYDLPPERIAQEPLPDRSASRLLHVNRKPGSCQDQSWEDRKFREFPGLLRPDDLLVVNNTRVFPARLYGHRSGQRAQPLSPRNPAARDFLRGRIEVLLTRQVGDDPNDWECLVRPGRKIGIGEKLYFSCPPGDAAEDDAPELEAEVTQRGSFGERRIRFAPVPDFYACVERIGHVPLPPY